MALKATVHRAELQVSDIDRSHYASYSLTLAQHPSETDERLMVRLLAFALLADERLAFGRGLSTDDEPDLWRRSLTGEIEQWVELGQPDESRLRKASGRSREVVLVGYTGRAFSLYLDKNATALKRLKNLRVIEIPTDAVAELAAMLGRGMNLQCLIQDADVQLIGETASVSLTPLARPAESFGPA